MSQVAGLYDMEETLGQGHFAVVKSARHVFTGLRVAIKVIDKLKLDEVSKTHLYQEVRCMKLVTHPSIIRLYEVIDTQNKLYLIQELGDGGDLYDYIMKNPNGIDEDVCRTIFRQTVAAIRYCHRLHVVHRDLKPENLVFCTGGGRELPRVKLTDFGLSRTFLPGELIESSCGSLEYSAPEILLGDSYDPPKIDVWSLGVILFMMITGHSPFACGTANEVLTHIMDGKYTLPTTISESCRALISTMLVVEAANRVSLEQVATHHWLTQDIPLVCTPQSIPPFSSLEDIPEDIVESVLTRLELGGYGTQCHILGRLKNDAYGSTSATFFLLAEAERHRQMSLSPLTPSRIRKVSMPVLNPIVGPFQSPSKTLRSPSPRKTIGSAETGILTRRRPQLISSPRYNSAVSLESSSSDSLPPGRWYSSHENSTTAVNQTILSGFTPVRTTGDDSPQHQQAAMKSSTPYSQYSSPSRGGGGGGGDGGDPATYLSPKVGGINGEQQQWKSPTPSFPLTIKQDEEVQIVAPVEPGDSPHHLSAYSSGFHQHRPLATTFEEESETDSLPDMNNRGVSISPVHSNSPRSHSPHSRNSMTNSPVRSRRLLNARSSPSIAAGIMTKSDGSDEEEEEDDDIVELMTTSGRFPKGNTFPRMSPSNSPLLTSRKSPTPWTGSSDEEVSGIFEAAQHRRLRHKRSSFRRRSLRGRQARVNSVSSDDGGGGSNPVVERRITRQDKLLRMRHVHSLPDTPVDGGVSESLTELLENIRRQRSNSHRSGSSLSERSGGGGERELTELANSLVSKFEISDEELEKSSDIETEQKKRKTAKHKGSSTTLRSVFCTIL